MGQAPLAVVIGIGSLCVAVVSTGLLVRTIRDENATAQGDIGAFLAALLAYSLFYAVFFAQSFLSGDYIAPSDSLDFGVADYLSSPAFWTEGIWSGYPVAADPQALTFYPVLRLFRALGIDWNIFLISAYVLTSATTFLLVRRLTRSTLAGAFSGFVCGFSGLVIGYITNFNQIHAFAWVPLALYGVQLIREGATRPGALVTALATALMWLAGHPQVPVYSMYLIGAIVGGSLIVDRSSFESGMKRVRWSAIALALGFMLAAVALLPMLELSLFSPRAESSWSLYASSALPPRELLALLMPFAFGGFWTESGAVPYVGESGDSGYVGLLAVALALAAPFVLRSHRREARLWVVIGLFEALLCLGPATPVGVLFYYAPGYSSFQAPLRHLFLLTLCMAVGAGLAFAELTTLRERRTAVALAMLTVAFIGAAGYALLFSRTQAMRALVDSNSSYTTWAFAWPLVIAGTLVVLMLAGRHLPDNRRTNVALGVCLVAFQVGDLAMLHYRLPGRRFEYADVRRAEAVPHPKVAALRAELQGAGTRVLATDGSKNPFLLPNLTRAWEIPAASGTGSLPIQRYLEVLDMGTSGSVSSVTLAAANRGVDLFGIRYALVRQDSELARNARREVDRWQPVENVHYYEDDPDTYYTLLRNLRALPRAWCAGRVVAVTPPQALSAIHGGVLPDGTDFDPVRVALVEDGPVVQRNDLATTASATVAVDQGQPNSYAVRSPGPCMLVMSEVYYPWWRASIDGTPVELRRVNHAMLGVPVPGGSHVVRLWIVPTTVWIGAAISGVGLLVWLFLWR